MRMTAAQPVSATLARRSRGRRKAQTGRDRCRHYGVLDEALCRAPIRQPRRSPACPLGDASARRDPTAVCGPLHAGAAGPAVTMRAGRSTSTVAIIGCGLGGIAVGVKLSKAGMRSFTIFERSDGPGGVWWENRYPGAEVDVPSLVYSFSFKQYDWTSTHATQRELQRYLETVIDEFGLRPHCRFGTAIREVIWNDKEQCYLLRTEHGEELFYDVVISALGLFNSPRYPDWPGLDDFEGPKFHTARWEPQHDLSGKRVAVVGTGSTAAQVVPALAPLVGHLFVFQRDPGWILPKEAHDLSDSERTDLRRPLAWRIERLRLFWAVEWPALGGRRITPGTRANKLEERRCREFIRSVLRDRPDLQDAVNPRHAFGGKRTVYSDMLYRTFLRDNVELVPHAVVRATRSGVVDATGAEHAVDAIVMATGFATTDYLSTLRLVGRHGRTIQEVWQGEPRAFLGISIPGFPNFYMIYGPNTNGINLVAMFEHQADYIVRTVKRMRQRGIASIEVRAVVADAYDRWLQRRLRATAWTTTRNYYTVASGRIVTQWPDASLLYGLLTAVFGRLPFINRHRRRTGASERHTPLSRSAEPAHRHRDP
jgi:cation diffusion facilitator CzcD-associated flavoprotein CzcO